MRDSRRASALPAAGEGMGGFVAGLVFRSP